MRLLIMFLYLALASQAFASSASIKVAAQRIGVPIGVGPVDPSGGIITSGYCEDLVSDESGCADAEKTWTDIGPFDFSWPLTLNTATDAGAALIVNQFGGMMDLCAWAVGPLDYSHFGHAGRWNGPSSYDFSGVDETYAFALANGMQVVISDPAYSGVPGWLRTAGYTPAQVTALLHNWYTAVYSRYPAAVQATFFNELFPYHFPDVPADHAAVANSYSIEWYYQHSDIGAPGGKTLLQFANTVCSWVKAANPNIKILVNQNSIEGYDTTTAANASAILQWIQALKDQGTPIAGIGVQGHFFDEGKTFDYAGITSTLQSFFNAGLEVHITEFDLPGSDATWVQKSHDLVAAIFASGRIKTFTFWGIKNPQFVGGPGMLYDVSYDSSTHRLQNGTLAPTSAVASIIQAMDAAPVQSFVQPPLKAIKLRSTSGGKIKGKGAGKVSGKPQ